MKKKQQKIQFALIFIGSVLIILTYFYYPSINKNEVNEGKENQKKVINNSNAKMSTNFENVEYKGLYNLDKNFTIKSKTAYIKNDEPDIVFMNTMHVVLYLDNGREINIFSDEGSYNKLTYDCFFEKNVRATDGDTKIFAENLDLLTTKSSAEIYNSVNLYYSDSHLQADKINYDFIKKDFKVSMFGDKAVQMKVIE
jgi:hypothetical protein|tara:strand:+ start:1578 stop:2168 length:591 start_codon:yes stop_codon:yes gene_type:complete